MSFTRNYARKLRVNEFKGYWDASLNEPQIVSGIGVENEYYIVSVAGNTTIDGASDWKPTDIIEYTGSVWIKIDNTDEVSLDSPAFIGSPTAPTPSLNDNSNKIATTAFVKNQGYSTITGAETLTNKTLASPAITGSISTDVSFNGNVTIAGRLYISANSIYANSIMGGTISTSSDLIRLMHSSTMVVAVA